MIYRRHRRTVFVQRLLQLILTIIDSYRYIIISVIKTIVTQVHCQVEALSQFIGKRWVCIRNIQWRLDNEVVLIPLPTLHRIAIGYHVLINVVTHAASAWVSTTLIYDTKVTELILRLATMPIIDVVPAFNVTTINYINMVSITSIRIVVNPLTCMIDGASSLQFCIYHLQPFAG